MENYSVNSVVDVSGGSLGQGKVFHGPSPISANGEGPVDCLGRLVSGDEEGMGDANEGN